MLFIHSLKIN